jgi:hypothetical protein
VIAFVHKSERKHGGFVKFALPAANRWQETRFGAADAVMAVILACLLLGTAAAVRYFLAR